jgi:hypothetical protein
MMARIVAVVVLMATLARGAPVDLHGSVNDEKGAPAPGVTVYIGSVSPKQGEGFGDGYYTEWGKKALTDGEGKFVIEGVDPELRYGLLVVTEGHQAVRVSKADPAKEVKAKLKAMPEDRKESIRQIRGRVTGEDGKPVWGAEVAPTGWGSGGSHTFGQDRDADQETVTDQKGEFVITGKEPDRARDLLIQARGYAPTKVALQPPGEEVHEFALTKGSTIKGRIVKEGKGLANVAMQAVQSNRRSESFLAPRVVKSDEQGNFALENLKSDEEYCLTALGRSLPPGMCTALAKWKTSGEGETVEAGDVEAVVGKTIKGKIKMPEGKTVPSGSLTLGGDERWDSSVAKLGKDGSFEFKGVAPGEAVRLYVLMAGYRVSKENASADFVRGQGLIGIVEDDIPNLVILLEEGAPQRVRGAVDGNRSRALRTQRLQGVTEEAAAEEKK